MELWTRFLGKELVYILQSPYFPLSPISFCGHCFSYLLGCLHDQIYKQLQRTEEECKFSPKSWGCVSRSSEV